MRDDPQKAIRRAMMIARQPAAYGGGYGAFPTDPSMMAAQTPVMTEAGPVMQTQGQLDAALGNGAYARGGDVDGRLDPRDLPGFHVRVPAVRASRADGGPVQEPQDDDVRIDNPIIGYHGSPHEFSRFDLSKIGTGEGNQAYGHGSYIAENENVARGYRDALKTKPLATSTAPMTNAHRIAGELYDSWRGDLNGALDDAKFYDNSREVIAALRKIGANPPTGHMYEVAIHARPDEFLDWDKPLDENHPARKVLYDAARPVSEGVYGDVRSKAMEALRQSRNPNLTGEGLHHQISRILDGPANAAAALAEAGIPGIRYLDAGSRGAGDGTRNYVVFHPKHMEIKRRYAEGGAAPKMNLDDDATMQKALRVTAKNRPTVALADDFVRQLRGRPRA